jgi:hypothetical protein
MFVSCIGCLGFICIVLHQYRRICALLFHLFCPVPSSISNDERTPGNYFNATVPVSRCNLQLSSLPHIHLYETLSPGSPSESDREGAHKEVPHRKQSKFKRRNPYLGMLGCSIMAPSTKRQFYEQTVRHLLPASIAGSYTIYVPPQAVLNPVTRTSQNPCSVLISCRIRYHPALAASKCALVSNDFNQDW